MNCDVAIQLLRDGITELNNRRMISNDLKTEVNNYLDGLTTLDVKDVEFIDFNQDDSTGFTFDTANRNASAAGVGELLTNLISLNNVRIHSFKLKGTDQNVEFLISYNGTTWYNINDYDALENVAETESGFYLRVDVTQANTISGIQIIYENL